MDFTRILYEKVEPDIVKITMNRPEMRNAQDWLMLEELQDAFVEADLDEDVRVIILAGAGKDFCASHDLSGKGEDARGPIIGRAMATKLTGMEMRLKKEDYVDLKQGQAMRNVSKPSIAMVQGNAVSSGWQMASMCDLIVASEDAQFREVLPRYAYAGIEVLFHPYDVGVRKAKEMMWTGEPISAQKAEQIGLVNRVVPKEKLEEETLDLARKIAKIGPVVASLIKRSLNHAWDEMGQSNAWQYHMLIHQLSHASDEAKRLQEERAQAIEQRGLKETLPARGNIKKA